MPRTLRSTTDPVVALKDALAFNSRDWGKVKADAWLWGIIHGWDDPEDPEGGAMDELAARHGWDEFDVATLRELHRRFATLVEHPA